MTPPLRLPAPAKINLFLHVLGRRADGYHNLETLFQLLDWGDELEFTPAASLEFTQQPAAAFAAEDNLVVRAARLLQAHSGCTLGARIDLHKRIPVGAGLGGGSSDAATTLLGLNHLWGLGLEIDELADLGLKLGADVPVFVRGQSALAEGVGEKLTSTPMEERWFLVVTPQVHVSTAEIFGHPQLTRDAVSVITDRESQLTCDGRNSKIRALADLAGRNDCQAVVEKLHPDIAKTRNLLEPFGPVRMSGTGSSLFMQFAQRQEAEKVLTLAPLEANAHQAFIARGVNQSAVHTILAGCQTS